MARLPDRFDLQVRRARECADPARQADYLLGSLVALEAWHFLNIGTKENPEPAQAELGGGPHLLVFSDAERIEELVRESGSLPEGEPPPVIAILSVKAMPWCLGQAGCAGLLVNPGGENAFVVPMDRLEIFHAEWNQRGGRQASGFWIPNMTSEEEDFWQEHGL